MANNDTQIRITAVDATQAAFASVSNGLKGVETAASGLNTIADRIPMLGTALTAALGGATISGFIKSTIDAADNLNDLSQSLGLSIRDLTAYKLVADQSGTSLESVGRGIKKLSTTIMENGKALRAAGVDTKSASSAMEGIADIFAGMPEGIERTALASKLFGEKIGAELIPMLSQGSQALRESAEKTARLGAIYEQMAPQADQFNDSMAELSVYASAAGTSIASEYLPALVSIGEAMAEAAKEGSLLDVALAAVGTTMSWVFTDANLPRENQIAKRLKSLRADMSSEMEWGGRLSNFDVIPGFEFGKRSNAQINAINEQMLALQKELDALLQHQIDAAAAKRAESAKKATDEVIARRKELMKQLGLSGGKEEADALQKSLDAIRNQSIALDVGLSPESVKNIETLGEALSKGKIKAAEYNKLLGDVLDKDSPLAAEQKELTQAHQEYMRSIGDETAKLIEKANASELELQTIGLTADQMAALTARRYDEQISIKEAALESARGVAGREAEVFLIEQQIDALRRLKGSEIAKPKLQEQAREWEKFTSDIERGLTDSLYRAFENGDGFGKTFVDSLKNTLKAAALKVVVQAIVDPVMGGVKGVLSGPAGGSGYANQGSSFLGAISNANNVWSGAVNTGTAITGIGNLIGSSMVSSFGTGMSLGSAGAAEAIAAYQAAAAANAGTAAGASYAATASSMSAGASVASAMPYVAAAIAVYSLFSKKGKEDPHNNADTVYASFRASASGAAGYGRVPEDGASNEIVPYTTVMGQTSGRGRWGDSTAMTAEQIATLNTGLSAMYQSAHKMAEMFGVSGDAIDSVTLDIQSQATASEGLGVAMQRGLDKLSDALTRAVLPNIDDFRLGSETLGQTLARVAGNMQAVDTWGARLGFTLNGLTEKNTLTAAFGDSSAMSAALDAYYQSYYTEAERTARLGDELAAAFGQLNLAMPTSTDGLRAMVSATVDSKAGWEQTYAALIALSPAFKQFIDASTQAGSSIADTAQAMRAAADIARQRRDLEIQLMDAQGNAAGAEAGRRADALAALDPSLVALQSGIYAAQDAEAARQAAIENARAAADAAFSTLERSIEAQRRIAQSAVDVAREQTTAIQGVFNTLDSNIKSLYSSTAGFAADGMAFIDNALANANSSGYLPESSALSDAIAAARQGLDSKVYASTFEQERDRLVLAGKLSQLREISGDQLTTAEQQLKAAEDSVSALDGVLENARAQLDQLKGIDNSVITVAAAVVGLGAAIDAARATTAAPASAALYAAAGSASAVPATQRDYAGMSAEQFQQAMGLVGEQNRNQLGQALTDWYGTYSQGKGLATPLQEYLSMLNGRDGTYLTTDYAAAREKMLNEARAAGLYDVGGSESTAAYEAWLREMRRTGLPGFAVGTNYVPSDMVAKIHQGERIIPAADNRELMRRLSDGGNTARLERLVEGLTKEVQRLQGIVNDGNREQRRTADAVNGSSEVPMVVKVAQ